MGKPATFTSLIALLAAVLLGGCARVQVPTPGVYKLDIQQGNVVTEDMLARLRPGMEKRKVRFLLGTPIIVDAFSPDRWNYLYTFQKGGHKREQRRIVVLFEDDRLVSVEGDVVSALTRKNPEHLEQVVTVPDQDQGTIFGNLTKVIRGDDARRRKPQSEKGFFARVFGGGDATQPESQEVDEAESGVAGAAAEPDSVEADAAQEPAQESGLFSKLKNVFQSDTAPLEESAPPEALLPEGDTGESELGDAIPPPPAAEQDTQVSAPAEPASEESPSFFTRLKQRFSGNEESPESDETTDAEETTPDENATAGDQPEAEDDGFFARLKRRFSSEEQSAEPVPEASTEGDEQEEGFFKKLSTKFGLGEQPPAEAAEQQNAE